MCDEAGTLQGGRVVRGLPAGVGGGLRDVRDGQRRVARWRGRGVPVAAVLPCWEGEETDTNATIDAPRTNGRIACRHALVHATDTRMRLLDSESCDILEHSRYNRIATNYQISTHVSNDRLNDKRHMRGFVWRLTDHGFGVARGDGRRPATVLSGLFGTSGGDAAGLGVCGHVSPSPSLDRARVALGLLAPTRHRRRRGAGRRPAPPASPEPRPLGQSLPTASLLHGLNVIVRTAGTGSPAAAAGVGGVERHPVALVLGELL